MLKILSANLPFDLYFHYLCPWNLRHRQLCPNRQVGKRQALRHRERLYRPPRAGLRRTRNARLASRLRHLWQPAQPQGQQGIRAI